MERENTLFRMFGKFYPQGTILFSASDLGDEMYYIQSGTLKLTDKSEGGGKPRVLRAGDILGEESLLEKLPRLAMAEVSEDSRLLVINTRNIDSMARNGPQLAASIMGEVMKLLDENWNELRLWQSTFFLAKLEVFFRRSEGTDAWTITEVSENTEIEEEGIRRVFEWLVDEGGLTREGDRYHLKDLAVVERLAGTAAQPG